MVIRFLLLGFTATFAVYNRGFPSTQDSRHICISNPPPPPLSNCSGFPAKLTPCSQFFGIKGTFFKNIKLLGGKKKVSICKFPTWPCLPAKIQKSPGEGKEEEDCVSLFSFQMELTPTGYPHTQVADVTLVISVVLCRPWASTPMKINNSEHI